jgi:CHRD domain/FG-GAP-like repeat
MKSSRFWILLVFTLMLSATVKAETFFAYLSSAQEVPTNASTATGYARVFLNESAGTINFTIVFSGLSSNQVACHIHAPAAIGANSGVAINFGAVGGTSGTITGTAAITATQIAQLRAHQGYVNLHSANFAGGEIRGQLGVKRPVDFDGDGRQDYSVLRFPAVSPQPITYWNNNSTTGTQLGIVFGDAATDFPAPGDYDGDGKDDVAIYRSGATAGAQSDFWILRSSDNVGIRIPFGLNGDQAVNRDFDGDGKTDLAIFRRGATAGAQAFWWIRRSTVGLTVTGNDLVIPFGTTGDVVGGTTGDTPIPGDYDGDGKFDLAVYRFGGIAPDNTYIIRRSSDNTVSFQPFGNFNTDYILPGDYDGDGKYDLAIARLGANLTSPIVWWILQSSNGQIRTQPFGKGSGAPGSDIPAQGDYDGDAKADIAVYRPGATAAAQSNFWVFRSFDNTAQVTPWGLGADFAVNTFDIR